MKNTKNMKWFPVLFYITSACYFLVACLHLFGQIDTFRDIAFFHHLILTKKDAIIEN